jgi:hypothetical protein
MLRREEYLGRRAYWLGVSLLMGCFSTTAGSPGAPDAGPTCVLTSDCPRGQHCSPEGRCTLECREDRDCTGQSRCELTVGRCVASDAGPPLTTDVRRLVDDRPAPLPDVFDAGLHASDVVDVEVQPDVPVLADVVDVVVPPDAMAALDVSTAPPDAGCGPEVCNGVDDDCDGVIDNLLPTACTFGPCATGMRRCPMGLVPGTRFVESTPAVCERDAFAPTSTVCRPAAGACDVAENCTGVDAECPPDRFASAGEVCRASTSVEACDPAERCTGVRSLRSITS